jgi:hypothetical protein
VSDTNYSGAGTVKDLVPGTLRGYRAWDMDALPSRLLSLSMPYAWVPRYSPPAVCYMRQSVESFLKEDMRLAPHSPPALGCSCGYYATYNLKDLYTFQDWGVLASARYVIGTVKAYGSVMLGTIGFRAQYMEIEALARSGPRVAEKAAAYGVPVVPSFEALVSQYPPSSVDELIGAPRANV